jgi:hypothetical protein
MKLSTALSLVASCATLFLAGCVTTQTRINDHPEIFQSLSANDQALVSRGEIRPGMSQNAVWLAWGNPDQKLPGNVHGRPAETWVYMNYTDAYPGPFYRGYPYGPYGFGFGGGYVVRSRHGHRVAIIGDPFYDPFFYSPLDYRVRYPSKIVSFQNGRVVALQYLMPPY